MSLSFSPVQIANRMGQRLTIVKLRYVVELQSMLHHYVIPLLNPVSVNVSTPSEASTSSYHTGDDRITTSHAATRNELPIASRFLNAVRSSVDHPSSRKTEVKVGRSLSTSTFSLLPRHPLRPVHNSESKPRANESSFHSHSPSSPSDLLLLPDGLRRVLEVIPEMVRGHEELSIGLRVKWEKEFPLVRGLGSIWSQQVEWTYRP